MDIALYTLTSPLHDQEAVNAASASFVAEIESELGCAFEFKGADFSDYGTHELDLIFVRTGGTESLFEEQFYRMRGKILLLTSGKSNSLAASMEILSYLNQRGRKGEILHGSASYIAERISLLAKVASARKSLQGTRLGVIGKPSDWLISSEADPIEVRKKLGVELVDVDIEELCRLVKEEMQIPAVEVDKEVRERLEAAPPAVRNYSEGALAIYRALKRLVCKYKLSGLTLRCFDLLSSVNNTGCLALAMLNSEGIPAACEGDVPALLSMTVGRALTGICGFQANPSRIDPDKGEMLFAHCTVPFNMLRGYSFNTHFESGIGVAVHGELPEGHATLFKLSGDLKRHFCCPVELIENQYGASLCRTQILLRSKGSEEERRRLCSDYFLTAPIGNHHIVFSGDHAALFEAFMSC